MVRLTTDTRPHLVTVMWTGAPGGGRAPRSLTLRLVLEFSHPPHAHCIFHANQSGSANPATFLCLDHTFRTK